MPVRSIGVGQDPGSRAMLASIYIPTVLSVIQPLFFSLPIVWESICQGVYLLTELAAEPGLMQALEMTSKGIPIGRPAEVNLRNNHAQYIFTWYAFPPPHFTPYNAVQCSANTSIGMASRLPRPLCSTWSSRSLRRTCLVAYG